AVARDRVRRLDDDREPRRRSAPPEHANRQGAKRSDEHWLTLYQVLQDRKIKPILVPPRAPSICSRRRARDHRPGPARARLARAHALRRRACCASLERSAGDRQLAPPARPAEGAEQLALFA